MSDISYASLSFLTNYTDGTKKDEIEYEIYKAAFQIRNATHYDRAYGGSFQDIEQEPQNGDDSVLMLRFITNLIQSIYIVNQERNFNPYIVVGFSDVKTEIINSTFVLNVSYRLLNDITTSGVVTMEI